MGHAFFAAIVLLVVTFVPSANSQTPSTPAEPIHTLQVGALSRSYGLERFRATEATGRLPVIIFLHGSNTRITDPMPPRFDIPFDTVPGMEPALIVRPQGVDGRWNSSVSGKGTWRQDIRRFVGMEHEPVDDIAFLRALVHQLVTDDNGDPARVYVAGVSSGGYMGVRIACEMGDTVAAIAVVIATAHSAQLEHCPDTQPIPFMLLASTTDPIIAYPGWKNPIGGTASAPETVAFFRERNGCTTRTEQPLPHLDSTVDSTVSLIRYTGCRDDADVLFYRVDGSGHSVPSKAPPEPGSWAASGSRNRDIETAQIVWDFLRSRRLMPTISP